MSKKKIARFVPPAYQHTEHYGTKTKFQMLGKVEINTNVVTFTCHQVNDERTPEYSDAELRLLIAQLNVAKETIAERIDRNIAMLEEILNPKDEAKK